MAKSSLDELRGKISAGHYALESGTLAEDILSKFALVRRVRSEFVNEDAGHGPDDVRVREGTAEGKGRRGRRLRGQAPIAIDAARGLGPWTPTDLPPCPGLRGELCRDYKAFENGRAPAK